MKNMIRWMLAGALLLAPAAVQASGGTSAPKTIEQQVRHELLMLPYYNVFDNLAYEVNGTEVVLTGQVTWPTVKSDAESVVRHIAGVTKVVNKIEVLPLSPFDDRLRLAVLRAVYRQGSLGRYGLGAQPSIRIIVKNGNVTLDGTVDNTMDRNLAYIYANGVPGVFSVTNNLQVKS